MPRKFRKEYPGATYHVINRGNYRQPAFADDRTKEAFMGCIFEACEKSAWILHAFIVMRNHYHLCVETPDGNLIAGMHWLQGTFANRFNRHRDERGHLFQGLYTSILTEEGKPVGEVCDYIHLNPVRAKILPIARLIEYRHSSYWYLRRPEERLPFMRPQTALECAGGLPDNSEGWAEYDRHLELVEQTAASSATGADGHEMHLTRGWAIGSNEFKAALIEKHNLIGATRSWDSAGVAELRAQRWETALAGVLRAIGRTEPEAKADRKSAPWKLAVAAWMRRHTQASNRWLTLKLNLGPTGAMSRNLTKYRRNPVWSHPALESRNGTDQV